MEQFSPTKFRATKYIGVYLGLILVILSFGGGLILGGRIQERKQIPANGESVEITKLINVDRSQSRTDSVEFNQFWTVWDRLKDRYVKKGEIKDVDLFYGAVQGMVA